MYDECMTKRRITVTVDADLVEEGERVVAEGDAPSLSAYVNDALKAHSARWRRHRALGEAIAAYEAEHGVITKEEMEETVRKMRERAIVVRGGKTVRA
jgi:Arc/MetJ-type ribon-helix-helix transcriptional regulator